MKMNEICEGIETELDERGPASKKLCLSSVPDDKLGASQLSSCKSQGFRTRHSKRTYYLGSLYHIIHIVIRQIQYHMSYYLEIIFSDSVYSINEFCKGMPSVYFHQSPVVYSLKSKFYGDVLLICLLYS